MRDVCHCGHDKATHFEKKGACLARGCDDCAAYAHEDGPKPEAKREKRPDHAAWCRCYRCKAYLPAA